MGEFGPSLLPGVLHSPREEEGSGRESVPYTLPVSSEGVPVFSLRHGLGLQANPSYSGLWAWELVKLESFYFRERRRGGTEMTSINQLGSESAPCDMWL